MQCFIEQVSLLSLYIYFTTALRQYICTENRQHARHFFFKAMVMFTLLLGCEVANKQFKRICNHNEDSLLSSWCISVYLGQCFPSCSSMHCSPAVWWELRMKLDKRLPLIPIAASAATLSSTKTRHTVARRLKMHGLRVIRILKLETLYP